VYGAVKLFMKSKIVINIIPVKKKFFEIHRNEKIYNRFDLYVKLIKILYTKIINFVY